MGVNGMNPTIEQNKHFIILAGHLLGILYILEILPRTTDIMNLGTNVNFVWIVCIIACGYVYYKSYMQQTIPVRKPVQHIPPQPTNKDVLKEIEKIMQQKQEEKKRASEQNESFK